MNAFAREVERGSCIAWKSGWMSAQNSCSGSETSTRPVHTGERSGRKMRFVGRRTEPGSRASSRAIDAHSRWPEDEHRFDDLFVEDVGVCSPVVGETETGLEVADDPAAERRPRTVSPALRPVFDQLPVLSQSSSLDELVKPVDCWATASSSSASGKSGGWDHRRRRRTD